MPLHGLKCPGETMYTPKYLGKIFCKLGFSEIEGYTLSRIIALGQKPWCVNIRNALFNLTSPFCFWEYGGAVQISLFCKNARVRE